MRSFFCTKQPSVLSMATVGDLPRICTCIRLQLTSSTEERAPSKSTFTCSQESTVTPLHLPVMLMVA